MTNTIPKTAAHFNNVDWNNVIQAYNSHRDTDMKVTIFSHQGAQLKRCFQGFVGLF